MLKKVVLKNGWYIYIITLARFLKYITILTQGTMLPQRIWPEYQLSPHHSDACSLLLQQPGAQLDPHLKEDNRVLQLGGLPQCCIRS